MTYTTYKTTTQNASAGISEPAWKNPVNEHDFKNDPERDNHLFDSHKAYHAKDDVKALRNILHQLKELGGDYGFNSDFKTNPQGKMRCTLNSGRKRKTEFLLRIALLYSIYMKALLLIIKKEKNKETFYIMKLILLL